MQTILLYFVLLLCVTSQWIYVICLSLLASFSLKNMETNPENMG